MHVTVAVKFSVTSPRNPFGRMTTKVSPVEDPSISTMACPPHGQVTDPGASTKVTVTTYVRLKQMLLVLAES